MTWRKLGRIYAPAGGAPWMRSHASNPVAEWIANSRFRVYFSSRDDRNRSSIGVVEIDLDDLAASPRQAETLVLSPGGPGAFDDSGVSIGSIVPVGESRYLYYMGWHLPGVLPWQNAIGLAVSDGPGEPFRRVSPGPVVALNAGDPLSLSYPWVSHDEGRFRMWYGSHTAWGPDRDDMRHLIKYAESQDGLEWDRRGVAIGFDRPGEYAICRPSVVRDGRGCRMWFSARGQAYRIFEAESLDGTLWTRSAANPALDISKDGWDSGMVEYPCVFDHQGTRYMLYNGNGFGMTGFGLAVLEP
jgi:hypothetical protein